LGNFVDLESHVPRPFTRKTRVSKQRTDSCLIPYLPISSLNTANYSRMANGSPLSDIGEAEGIESHVADRRKNRLVKASFTGTERNIGRPSKSDCGIIDVLFLTLRYFRSRAENSLSYKSISSTRQLHRNFEMRIQYHAMAYYCSTDLSKFTKQRNPLYSSLLTIINCGTCLNVHVKLRIRTENQPLAIL